MARASGSAWPWLLADNSNRIVGLRAPDDYETYLVMQWFGAFSSLVDQTASANTATAMTFNTVDYDGAGITIASNSRITVDADGLYNIQFSAQLENSGGQDQNVSIWLAKNGAAVSNSNTQISVQKSHAGGNGQAVAAWNLYVRLKANEYVELMWSTPSTDVSIQHIDAQTTPARPVTPSVILTVNRVN